MRLAIDATNIRGGGGVTHLRELLGSVRPNEYGIDRVLVWSGRRTLNRLPDTAWIDKINRPEFERSLLSRVIWQRARSAEEMKAEACDLLFVPGGTYGGAFRPYVAMSQNLLPFEWQEARRYGFSPLTLKFLLLRRAQVATFRRAAGLIFLTDYARKAVAQTTGRITPLQQVIPHGVDDRFRLKPRKQKPLSAYSKSKPFRILYVSVVAPYKHHLKVLAAVQSVRASHESVVLELIGGLSVGAQRFKAAVKDANRSEEWVHWRGEVPFDILHQAYHEADAFLFASSCENLPNILLEAMAAGLPIACSDRGPMPEVLGEAGAYFNPEDPDSIATALEHLLGEVDLRQAYADLAYERATRHSWRTCAQTTMSFLAQVAGRI